MTIHCWQLPVQSKSNPCIVPQMSTDWHDVIQLFFPNILFAMLSTSDLAGTQAPPEMARRFLRHHRRPRWRGCLENNLLFVDYCNS